MENKSNLGVNKPVEDLVGLSDTYKQWNEVCGCRKGGDIIQQHSDCKFVL
jgi:hypothetical protein